MHTFTLNEYRQAGCHLLSIDNNSQNTAENIVRDYAGKVCENGCRFFNNKDCAPYKYLEATVPLSATTPICTETVKDEAARLGLSLGDVRKLRRGDKIKDK